MYRKFLSAILFGALTIASTSTFVSCKDYDDDIDALNARVDANDADNKALHDALDAANQELTNLKAQLASEVARLDGLVAAAQGTADQAIKDAAAAQATADQAVKDAAAAQATADQALKLSQENKEAIANEIIRATAAEEALRVRIQTLEEVVIPELRQLIKDLDDKKLDKKTFNEEVAKIYARLEAVETGLGKALERIETLEKGLADEILARKALAEDLEQQKKIIANHETRLKELEEKVVPELRQLIQKLREDYEADVKRIDEAISKLAERVTKNENDIKDLKEDVRKINEELEKINNKLNELNVLILRSLRSLVFIPDFYYWGIEATELSGVYYKYWTKLPDVNADTPDPTWGKLVEVEQINPLTGKPYKTWECHYSVTPYCYDHNGHVGERKEGFIVENFVANYHLNPSSADLSKLTKADIHILSADRKYRTKAEIADKKDNNITVASFDPEKDVKNGNLSLNLNILKPELIKKIGHVEDGPKGEGRHFVQDPDESLMVTTFATEISIKDAQDNTVTSDYAALLANTYANGYRLAHTAKGDPDVKGAGLTSSFTGIVNNTETQDPTAGHENPLLCKPCPAPVDGITLPANRHLFTDATETVYQDGKNIPLEKVDLVDQPLVSALGADPSTTTAQDIVVWNGTINLSKLVEVHRLGDENVPESLVKAAEMKSNGFKIEFELTGIFMAKNVTSESAHAAIKIDDNGDYILRPQLPDMFYQEDGQNIGKAAAWEKTKQDRTTIGRTPLVRVKLIDTKHDNRILDYGYIRLVIIDTPQTILPETYATVQYVTGNSTNFSYTECDCKIGTPKDWVWRQKWGSFENDLYNMFSLSQRDFEDRYEAVLKDVPDGIYNNTTHVEPALKQYLVKFEDGKIVTDADGNAVIDRACTKDEYLGYVTILPGELIGEGTKTQVLDWTVEGPDLLEYGNQTKLKETTRAIKYQLVNAADRSQYKDIYVVLQAGDIKITKTKVADVQVTGKFDANKIMEYWYDENTQTTAANPAGQKTYKEAHLNVPSPEDWVPTWRENRDCPFEFLLSSDFAKKDSNNNPLIRNYIFSESDLKDMISITPKDNGVYTVDNIYEKSFGFVVLSKEQDGFKPNNKTKGYSGKTYTLSVGSYPENSQELNNWGLYASNGGKKELIAYLKYDESGEQNVNHIMIVVNKETQKVYEGQHVNSFAEDILNYKPYDDATKYETYKNDLNKYNKRVLELDDDVMKVILGFKLVWRPCAPEKPELCKLEREVPAFQVRLLRPINVWDGNAYVKDAMNQTQLISLYDLVDLTDWRMQWNPLPNGTTQEETIRKPRRDRVVPYDDGNRFIVDYWYYYTIKHILVGNANEVPNFEDGELLNGLMHTNMNGHDIKTALLSKVSQNVYFTYVAPKADNDLDYGDPGYYGYIKYTNNRSTVDDFDVTVPIVVCYEWGHLYKDVTIHVRKTLENTDVKIRR